MEQLPATPARRALIISDSDVLSRLIAVDLRYGLGIETASLVLDPLAPQSGNGLDGDFDLLIVALSSPASEPLVALGRTTQIHRVGQIPILVISDRPFRAEPQARIAHLDFPFEMDGLCGQVRRILEASTARPTGDRPRP